MGISFKTFMECVPPIIAVKKPIMLRSRHGQGKSSVVYQLAQKVGLKVVERRASQLTEGDLLGLPKVDGKVTTWLAPDWIQECCDEPRVLFLDELNRATQEVKQGFFELCDSRKISGRNLHPDTLLFAAINGGESEGEYVVQTMDPAELDRWCVFDVEPSVEDFISYAREIGMHPLVVDFIDQSPSHLEHVKEFVPGKNYPSRRSWHRFSDCALTAEKNKQPFIVAGEQNVLLHHICNSFVGLEAAVAFVDFVKNCEKLVQVDDILIDGKLEMVEKFSMTEHSSFIAKIIETFDFKAERKEKETNKIIENLSNYLKTLKPELAMALLDQVMAQDNNNFILSFYEEVKPYVTDILLSDLNKEKEEVKTKKKK